MKRRMLLKKLDRIDAQRRQRELIRLIGPRRARIKVHNDRQLWLFLEAQLRIKRQLRRRQWCANQKETKP